MEAAQKQLKIKTGVCKRLVKEVAHYEKELGENQEKMAQMQAEGRDPYDIKAQERLVEESLLMIPDSKRRLEAAMDDLRALVEEHKDVEELAEKVQEALAVLPTLEQEA